MTMRKTSEALGSLQTGPGDVSGQFVDFAGERYYVIRNVDKMKSFLISVVSNLDHWMFISSAGGLTAGRESPKRALFPYTTVDKIHECLAHTGPRTFLHVATDNGPRLWEPFNREHDGRYAVRRNLYKNLLGNKICFEEANEDLALTFRYTWCTSDDYGFVRQCDLLNTGENDTSVEILDGLQNVLPAGTPAFAQTNTSNLVDAYKWTELDEATGLAMFTLYSGITDRAEPSESLKANTVFCLGLDGATVLISSDQLGRFRRGEPLLSETGKRGVRGAYFVGKTLNLAAKASRQWQLVVDIEQSQCRVLELLGELANPEDLADSITQSVSRGCDGLARIMACADGFQTTAEENISVHHYGNVLFNVLRGGIVNDQYNISGQDFLRAIGRFNRDVYQRHAEFLGQLPDKLGLEHLHSSVCDQGDAQLERLCYEYLPITFGRRHGDPSRPWNQFAIRLKDDNGQDLLSYEGNWRDIFQNWEALAFSYPCFVEHFIAKFVNASTADGYNPYRITQEGIDWEIEEPDNPWSHIGYWGDHQIIYLQKFLELSDRFQPSQLRNLLRRRIFSYANVPYRIRPFEALLADPKNTVDYDEKQEAAIAQRVTGIGADGKLLMNADDEVLQVSLLEKLLVPLLSKLGNLVLDGGIWLNTQRPEWNDANNALVGQGLSVVTLCYMRRYLRFLQNLLAEETEPFSLSSEVAQWLGETNMALGNIQPLLCNERVSDVQRYEALLQLGQAASRYRETVYDRGFVSGSVDQPIEPVTAMLDAALAVIDHSIGTNRREDGLFQAYNTLNLRDKTLSIEPLYAMLEGQVAALSSGNVAPEKAVSVLESLFASDIYRPDQGSFMLYPDRALPGFLEKNRIPADRVDSIPLLQQMLSNKDSRIVVRDPAGNYRFNADFTNVGDLNAQLNDIGSAYGDEPQAARRPLQQLFEDVFNHKAFTGRSGTMFGFEGLGCIYWHMVAKLLLAVQENYFLALDRGADKAICRQLGDMYYRVRRGIGFNKTPDEYGAFPTDPYSHTPKHSGARQPGMTGQVKEEILSRFGELGIRIENGEVRFQPSLLRVHEFVTEARPFRYLDVDGAWQELPVPADSLAFTWCQVPVIYELGANCEPFLSIAPDKGSVRTLTQLVLPAADSAEIFRRSGRIRRLQVSLRPDMLFAD